MNESKVVQKRKWPIRLAIILLASTIGIAGMWLIAGIVNVSSLSYVDDLRGYSLSAIQGSVEMVDDDTYNQRLSPFHDFNRIYPALFPEHIPDDGARFFFFAETVKPRREYLDRWEIYLCCKWGKEDYAAEKSRLKDLGETKSHNLFERDDLFPFPAFVYRYQSGDFFYALFDEPSNAVHYCFLCEIGSIENVVFDHSLAPTRPLLQW